MAENEGVDQTDVTDQPVSGRYFSLLSQPVKVYYGTIIKDNQIPVVTPAEELSSGWQNGHILYAFTDEHCGKLDMLSDAFRRNLILTDEVADANEEDSEVESGADEDNAHTEQQSMNVHEVELTAMKHRRRVLRHAEGQILTSYRDLSNPHPVRPNRRRIPRPSVGVVGNENTANNRIQGRKDFLSI